MYSYEYKAEWNFEDEEKVDALFDPQIFQFRANRSARKDIVWEFHRAKGRNAVLCMTGLKIDFGAY